MRHPVARNHALAGGNQRLAVAAVIVSCGLNGRRLTLASEQENRCWLPAPPSPEGQDPNDLGGRVPARTPAAVPDGAA